MGLLIKAGQAEERHLERTLIAKWSLTYPQAVLLKHIANEGPRTMGDIADAVGCSRGNLTGITDRLERDGWILRARSTTDRRVVDVRLLKVAEFVEVEEWLDAQPQPPANVTAWLERFLGQGAQATA